MKPAVDALVFDLGGVLVDVAFERAVAAWAAAAGVPAAALAGRFTLEEVFRAHERGQISDAQYFAAVRRMLGVDLDEGALAEGWNAIIGEAIPGIEELLAGLAPRLPLYVFSNTNPAHVAHFRPRHRALLAPFREVFCSCEIGLRKPDAAAFEEVARRIGAPASRLALFDDNPGNVAGARAVGMHAFHVLSVTELRRALAELGF